MAINNCGQQEFDVLLQERQEHFNRILMFHLYINSLQNKFDDLKLLNDEMKSQIIFLSEIKIDKSQKQKKKKQTNNAWQYGEAGSENGQNTGG